MLSWVWNYSQGNFTALASTMWQVSISIRRNVTSDCYCRCCNCSALQIRCIPSQRPAWQVAPTGGTVPISVRDGSAATPKPKNYLVVSRGGRARTMALPVLTISAWPCSQSFNAWLWKAGLKSCTLWATRWAMSGLGSTSLVSSYWAASLCWISCWAFSAENSARSVRRPKRRVNFTRSVNDSSLPWISKVTRRGFKRQVLLSFLRFHFAHVSLRVVNFRGSQWRRERRRGGAN